MGLGTPPQTSAQVRTSQFRFLCPPWSPNSPAPAAKENRVPGRDRNLRAASNSLWGLWGENVCQAAGCSVKAFFF